jgi:DNA-binding NtrC family response regulator
VKEGATDFIQKSWDEEKILSTVISAFRLHQSKLEIRTLKNKQKHLSVEMEKEHVVHWCRSDKMKRIYDMIDKVAPTEANILLTGENGTGKEIIARLIHNRSQRKNEIFVNIK